MRTPAPSNKRANSEAFRREECSRLYFRHVMDLSEIADGYISERKFAEAAGADPDDLRDLDEKAENVNSRIREAEDVIAKLTSERDRKVLRERFIERRTVPDIGKEWSYTDRSIHTFINEALANVYEHIPPGWRELLQWRDGCGPE